MSATVCVRFRPLSSKEKKSGGSGTCFQALDPETFVFKVDNEEELCFAFDRVFYEDSGQEDVYDFIAKPIVEDTFNGINGTIMTYGQTGAGKTYSMEGPSISETDTCKKGLIPRVADGIFQSIEFLTEKDTCVVKLSMVEIYMEKVRDLLDLTKDNLQIKESKTQGIFLFGVTEITILNAEEAIRCLERGISNRSVGETQMNMSSSRSHCVYIFQVHKESTKDGRSTVGKLILVDLAGSERVEKTGAEGKILEEAKTINRSLSALGNVINGLTTGKGNHIPYRDSKLTRILQDSLGGNSRCALLCCCSPSSGNATESLSTIRFGTRSKLLKTPVLLKTKSYSSEKDIMSPQIDSESWDRIWDLLNNALIAIHKLEVETEKLRMENELQMKLLIATGSDEMGDKMTPCQVLQFWFRSLLLLYLLVGIISSI